MHPFHAHCREALASIEAQGRYRRFTPLRKQAERFPLYRGRTAARCWCGRPTTTSAWAAIPS